MNIATIVRRQPWLGLDKHRQMSRVQSGGDRVSCKSRRNESIEFDNAKFVPFDVLVGMMECWKLL